MTQRYITFHCIHSTATTENPEALPATAQLVAPLPQLPLMGAQPVIPQPAQPFEQVGPAPVVSLYGGFLKWGYPP